MSDNVAITAGLGTVIRTNQQADSSHIQIIQPSFGSDTVGTNTLVDKTTPLPTQMGTSLTTDWTEVAINCASNGDNTIVALSGTKVIRVYGFFLKVNGSGTGVSLKWKDSVVGDLHPALPFNDKDGWILDPMGRPWFTLAAASALVLNLSAAIQVSGRLYYRQD